MALKVRNKNGKLVGVDSDGNIVELDFGDVSVDKVRFTDTDGDTDTFSIVEDGSGKLELQVNGTGKQEFDTGGNLNLTGELAENTSL